jgi:hypothetical protein
MRKNRNTRRVHKKRVTRTRTRTRIRSRNHRMKVSRKQRQMRGGDYATPTTAEFKGFAYPKKRTLYVVYPGGINPVNEYIDTLDTQGHLQDYQG